VTAADEARGTSTGTGTSTDSGVSPPDITCSRSVTAAAAVSDRCRSIAGQRRLARPGPDAVVAGGDADITGKGSPGLPDRPDRPGGEGVDHRADAIDVGSPVEQLRHAPAGTLLALALVDEHQMLLVSWRWVKSRLLQ
jgi:hypothetical protein